MKSQQQKGRAKARSWRLTVVLLALALVLFVGDALFSGPLAGYLRAGEHEAEGAAVSELVVEAPVLLAQAPEAEKPASPPADDQGSEGSEPSGNAATTGNDADAAGDSGDAEEASADKVEENAGETVPATPADTDGGKAELDKVEQIAQAMTEDGYAYVSVWGTPLHANNRVTGKAVLGEMGEGLVLATNFKEANEEDEAALGVVFETEEGQMTGFVNAWEVTLVPREEALAQLLPQPAEAGEGENEGAAEALVPEYYYESYSWPLMVVGFTPEEEETANEAEEEQKYVFVGMEPASEVAPGFYHRSTIEAEDGTITTVFYFQTVEGETLYRLYGEVDGVLGFYACDAEGVMTLPPVLVDVEADALLAVPTIVDFVDLENPEEPLETIVLDDPDTTVADLALPQTLRVEMSDGTQQELAVAWAPTEAQADTQALPQEESEEAPTEQQDDTAGVVQDAQQVTGLTQAQATQTLSVALSEALATAAADTTTVDPAQQTTLLNLTPVLLSDTAVQSGTPIPVIQLRGGFGLFSIDYGEVKLTTPSGSLNIESKATYNLQSDTAFQFNAIYAPDYDSGGVQPGTVLFIRCLEYGSAFTTSPPTGSGIVASYKLTPTLIALVLEAGCVEDIEFGYSTQTVALTDAQAAAWLASGSLPKTAVSVELWEGTFDPNATGTQPGDFMSGGTALLSDSLGNTDKGGVTPENLNLPANWLTATNYDRTVPTATGALTNEGLIKDVEVNSTTVSQAFGSLTETYTLFQLHKQSMPLVELTKIRMYLPDDRLELSGISDGGGNLSLAGWSVTGGSVQDISGGPNNGRYYYELEPTGTTRLFNNTLATGNTLQGLLVPLFQLVNESVGLDYDANTYKVYPTPAVNSVEIFYSTPNASGTVVDASVSVTGPVVSTFARQDAQDLFEIAANPTMNKSVEYSVNAGGSYTSVPQTVLFNAYTVQEIAGVKTELIPASGPTGVVETYDFPFEIQPTGITIFHEGATKLGGSTTELSSISYTLEKISDGATTTTTIPATDAAILGINAAIANANGAAVSQPISFGTIPSGYRVTQVVVNWAHIQTTANAYGKGTAGMANAAWGNSSTSVYENYHDTAVGFSFTVPTVHANGDPIIGGEDFQIGYSAVAAGSQSVTGFSNGNYLWYKVPPPQCPDPYYTATYNVGATTGTNAAAYKAIRSDDAAAYPIGSLGLTSQRSTDLRWLLNPTLVFDVTMSPAATLADGDAIAFLTGVMTADARLVNSGWKLVYTTNVKTVDTDYAITNANVTLPMVSGEYLTSLKLTYIGLVDIRFGSNAAGAVSTTMLTNIQAHAWEHNPLIPANKIEALSDADFSVYTMTLNGMWSWDNCGIVTASDGSNPNGQTFTCAHNSGGNVHKETGAKLPLPLYHYRQAKVGHYDNGNGTTSVSQSAAIVDLTAGTTGATRDVYQASESNIGRVTINPRVKGLMEGKSFDTSTTNTATKFAPWGIQEIIYVELPDDTFVPDLDNVKAFGRTRADGLLVEELVYVNPMDATDITRYLKLQLNTGVTRADTTIFKDGASTGANVGRDHVQMTITNANAANVGTSIDIPFFVLPEATVGNHYPIGDIYVDYKELADNYDIQAGSTRAAALATSDDGNTDWQVVDTVSLPTILQNLAGASHNMLKFNGGQTGAGLRYNVLKNQRAIVGLYPGKNIVNDQGWAYRPREVAVYPHEHGDIAAKLSVTAPDQNLEDYTIYLPLPRDNKSLAYRDNVNNPHAIDSEYDVWLTGVPSLVRWTTASEPPVTYSYTYDYTVDENSTYTDTAPTTLDDWKQVTGVRVNIGDLPASQMLTFNLPLAAPEKTAAYLGDEPPRAYIGGFQTYTEATGNRDHISELLLRGDFIFVDYLVTDPANPGYAWYDLDEDGIEGSSIHDLVAGLGEVTITLYDTDGTTLIHQVKTDASGNFNLRSHKRDPGQIVRVSMPVPASGSPVEDATFLPTETNPISKTVRYNVIERKTTANTTAWELKLQDDLWPLQVPYDPKTNTPQAGGYYHFGAGFVALPDIDIPDLDVVWRTQEDVTATMERYGLWAKASNLSYYNLEISDIVDTTLAQFVSPAGPFPVAAPLNWAANEAAKAQLMTIYGAHLGTTTATLTTVNKLGDVVTTTFNINVVRPKHNVDMQKVWVDDNNRLNGRPDNVQVQLYRVVSGGAPEKVGSPVTVTGATNAAVWLYDFGLQYSIDMQERFYDYYVVWEKGHLNYITEQVPDLVITSTLQTIAVEGSKIWNIYSEGFIIPPSVTVALQRSGVPFGSQQVASSGNETNWPYKFDGLLAYNKYETPYVYTVSEVNPPEECRVNVQGYNISNTIGPTIRVIKVDARDKKRLAGAEFTLRQLSVQNPEDAWGYDETAMTDGNGEIYFRNLPLGSYVVYETVAPEGYAVNPIRRSIVIDGSRNLHSVTIVNHRNVLGAFDEQLQGITNQNIGLCPD